MSCRPRREAYACRQPRSTIAATGPPPSGPWWAAETETKTAGSPVTALAFQPGTNLRAWLLRILTNLNVDRGRRLQRRPDETPLEEHDYYLANSIAESRGEQALEQERIVERLSQDSIVTALSALPDDFRDVVVLVDIGDFSYADAAQILDVPIGTVMSRLHRGRRILKQKLAEETLT